VTGGGANKASGRKEGSSFFEKKEAKKLCSFGAGANNRTVPCEKSFFVSFFSKKEDSSCHLHCPVFQATAQ
jgi:hypothetical protein